MRKAARLIVINAVIAEFLVALLNVGSLIGLAIYNTIRPIQHAEAYRFPNYRGIDWAEAHFAEYAEIESSFEAFYGWRYEPFQGRTIKIDEGGQAEQLQA